MSSLAFKLLLCLLVATVARAADEDSDSGQYNPDLYEKPTEAAETEEATTEATEEAAEPAEPEAESPAVPEAPALPEVVAAAPPAAVAPFPYPLLYAHQYTPLVYSTPHFFGSPIYPSVVL